ILTNGTIWFQMGLALESGAYAMSPKGPPPAEPSVIALAPRLPSPLLEPPDFLSDEERAIWEGAVTGMRRHSTFGEEISPLLELYVTTVAMGHAVGRELRGMPVSDKSFRRLMREHCSLTRMALTVASKLRLVPRRAPTR